MSPIGQRSLVLILARDLATSLATPVFIVDRSGDLVFYNEAAGRVLGKPFVEGEPMPAERWATAFGQSDDDGTPLGPEAIPLWTAFTEQRPAHRHLVIRGADGVRRRLSVTAFPLYARADEFVGALAVFWETPGDA
ncbi:MAG TPA: PAS domain-containing protein [Actinomycetota bacterium]|jgi:PAS domain-containing protein|nr:PAS domain-containing protein [Actinomycetota bacterium]